MADHENCTILIIEDDPDDLQVLTACLDRAGFKTLTARSRKTGLQLANTADLILLDAQFGIDLGERLKTQGIPIILLASPEDRFQAFDTLTKPLRVEEILARVLPYLALFQVRKELRQEMDEHRQTEETLRISEEKYRMLVENMNDVIFSLDIQGTVTYVSPAIERFLLYSPADVVGLSFSHFIHPDDLPELQASFERTLRGKLEPSEFRLFAKDGTLFHVRSSSRALYEAGKLAGITGIVVDITEARLATEALQRAHAEIEQRIEERTAELAHANRMLKVLSECNQEVIRATDESGLLKKVCHIIVESGSYKLAWIGFIEQDRTIRPVAHENVDPPLELGPAEIAIRSGKACIVYEPDSSTCYVSALPLYAEDRVFGVLTIYSALPFQTQEINLLNELAGDLAFGISSLRMRTERKRDEEELFNSRQMLRTILDTVAQRIFWKDRNSVYLGCNKPLALDCGYEDASEIVGITDYETSSAPVADLYRADDRLVMETDQPKLNYEELQIKSDGRQAWLLTSKVPLHDKDGQVIGILGSYSDITEHKRAEAEIAQRNRDLTLLNKVIAAVTSTLNTEDVLTDTCRELALAFDVPQAAAALFNAERTAATVVAEYRAAEQVSAMGTTLAIQDNPSTEYVIKHKIPLMVTDAQHDSRMTPVHEVMVRRGTASLLLLPLIVHDNVIGTIGLDAIQSREFTAQEIELATSATAAVSQALTNAYLYQELAKYKDILEQRVEARTAELKMANEQLRYEIIERQQAEEIIRERTLQLEAANKELEALSRIKDEFVSNVSHELRTPISILLLRQHLITQQPEEINRHLAVMRRETERLKHTIEDLLYLSRLDQRRMEMNWEQVNLNSMIDQYVEDRAVLATQRGLALTFCEQPALSPVMADPGLLGQVLGILLTNAINYTPFGGHIVVSTHNQGGRWVGFSVSDDGQGIPPEEMPRLFERFFRGQTGLESKAPGTGLGLAIAKEIVDRLSGRIDVESCVGQGVTFKVWLPLDDG